jgi:olfactory receptor
VKCIITGTYQSWAPPCYPLWIPLTYFFLTGVLRLEAFHIWFSSLFAASVWSPVGEKYFSLGGDEKLQPPWAQVLFPLHNLCLGCWHHYFFSSHNTGCPLVQYQDHQPKLDALCRCSFCMHLPSWIPLWFDHFVATNKHLRYAKILTNSRITKTRVEIFVWILVNLFLFLKLLSFCGPNVLSHSYCYYPDVIKYD